MSSTSSSSGVVVFKDEQSLLLLPQEREPPNPNSGTETRMSLHSHLEINLTNDVYHNQTISNLFLPDKITTDMCLDETNFETIKYPFKVMLSEKETCLPQLTLIHSNVTRLVQKLRSQKRITWVSRCKREPLIINIPSISYLQEDVKKFKCKLLSSLPDVKVSLLHDAPIRFYELSSYIIHEVLSLLSRDKKFLKDNDNTSNNITKSAKLSDLAKQFADKLLLFEEIHSSNDTLENIKINLENLINELNTAEKMQDFSTPTTEEYTVSPGNTNLSEKENLSAPKSLNATSRPHEGVNLISNQNVCSDKPLEKTSLHPGDVNLCSFQTTNNIHMMPEQVNSFIKQNVCTVQPSGNASLRVKQVNSLEKQNVCSVQHSGKTLSSEEILQMKEQNMRSVEHSEKISMLTEGIASQRNQKLGSVQHSKKLPLSSEHINPSKQQNESFVQHSENIAMPTEEINPQQKQNVCSAKYSTMPSENINSPKKQNLCDVQHPGKTSMPTEEIDSQLKQNFCFVNHSSMPSEKVNSSNKQNYIPVQNPQETSMQIKTIGSQLKQSLSSQNSTMSSEPVYLSQKPKLCSVQHYENARMPTEAMNSLFSIIAQVINPGSQLVAEMLSRAKVVINEHNKTVAKEEKNLNFALKKLVNEVAFLSEDKKENESFSNVPHESSDHNKSKKHVSGLCKEMKTSENRINGKLSEASYEKQNIKHPFMSDKTHKSSLLGKYSQALENRHLEKNSDVKSKFKDNFENIERKNKFSIHKSKHEILQNKSRLKILRGRGYMRNSSLLRPSDETLQPTIPKEEENSDFEQTINYESYNYKDYYSRAREKVSYEKLEISKLITPSMIPSSKRTTLTEVTAPLSECLVPSFPNESLMSSLGGNNNFYQLGLHTNRLETARDLSKSNSKCKTLDENFVDYKYQPSTSDNQSLTSENNTLCTSKSKPIHLKIQSEKKSANSKSSVGNGRFKHLVGLKNRPELLTEDTSQQMEPKMKAKQTLFYQYNRPRLTPSNHLINNNSCSKDKSRGKLSDWTKNRSHQYPCRASTSDSQKLINTCGRKHENASLSHHKSLLKSRSGSTSPGVKNKYQPKKVNRSVSQSSLKAGSGVRSCHKVSRLSEEKV